ncbi:hypothetical protein CDO87_14135 [Sagittula sp. P11]|uniref:hypothetical protein n=1 Tax=Sagittula sp. P11 TaxID=2009329 RepID=UPI000C2D4347|nr:hypothetical protein [Sagittula sp. P11]AUC54244.1 hypothetical protein CDO87_14135 [Sagittula sp. P11]
MTRAELEKRATELEIPFGPRWKDETLADKIAAAEADLRKAEDAGSAAAGPEGSVPAPEAEERQATDAQIGATTEAGEHTASTVAAEAGEIEVGNQADPDLDLPEPGAEGGLVIIGPKKGRWRAGRHFTPTPTIVLVSELAEAEREMIEGDPKLVVEFLPPDA